jgi:hypothetical protein
MDTNSWIAWRELGPRQIEYTLPIIHRQGENGKTHCGIVYGNEWVFDCHDSYEAVSCKRCLRKQAVSPVEGGEL